MPASDDSVARGVRCSADGREVTLRGLRSGTVTVAVILGAATVIGLLFTVYSPRPEAIPAAAPLLLISVAIALFCWTALQILSRERLFVGDDEIVYDRLVANTCWRRRSISRGDRIEVRVQPRGARRGVVITGGAQTWRIGQGLDPMAIEWLHGWLTGRLAT